MPKFRKFAEKNDAQWNSDRESFYSPTQYCVTFTYYQTSPRFTLRMPRFRPLSNYCKSTDLPEEPAFPGDHSFLLLLAADEAELPHHANAEDRAWPHTNTRGWTKVRDSETAVVGSELARVRTASTVRLDYREAATRLHGRNAASMKARRPAPSRPAPLCHRQGCRAHLRAGDTRSVKFAQYGNKSTLHPWI